MKPTPRILFLLFLSGLFCFSAVAQPDISDTRISIMKKECQDMTQNYYAILNLLANPDVDLYERQEMLQKLIQGSFENSGVQVCNDISEGIANFTVDTYLKSIMSYLSTSKTVRANFSPQIVSVDGPYEGHQREYAFFTVSIVRKLTGQNNKGNSVGNSKNLVLFFKYGYNSNSWLKPKISKVSFKEDIDANYAIWGSPVASNPNPNPSPNPNPPRINPKPQDNGNNPTPRPNQPKQDENKPVTSVSNDIVISGKVTDEMNSALTSATIVVKGTTIGTVTDFDGNYSLSVGPGNHELQVSYIGYESQIKEISVSSSISNFDFTLNSISIEDMELIISGGQEWLSSGNVVTPDLTYNTATAAENIGRLNPYYVQYEGGGMPANIVMHGFNPSYYKFNLNGVPLNSPFNGYMDMSLVPYGLLHDIEIDNAGESFVRQSGSYVSGISLQSPNFSRHHYLSFQGAGGTLGNAEIDLDWGIATSDNFRQQISLIYRRAANSFDYTNSLSGDLSTLENAGFAQYGTAYDISIGKTIKINNLFAYTDREVPFNFDDEISSTNTAFYGTNKSIMQVHAFRFNKNIKKVDIDLLASYKRELQSPEKNDFSPELNLHTIYGKFGFAIPKRKKLLFNFHIDHNTSLGTWTLDNATMDGQNLMVSSAHTEIGYHKAGLLIAAGYRQDLIVDEDGLSVAPPLPSFRLEARAKTIYQLRLNGQRNYRYLTMYERYLNDSGYSIPQESSWIVELFNKISMTRYLILSNRSYLIRSDNYTSWSLSSASGYRLQLPVYSGAALVLGTETTLEMNKKIGTKYDINIAAAHHFVTVSYDGTLSNTPQHIFKGIMMLKLYGLYASLNPTIFSKRKIETTSGTETLDGVFLMDLTAGYDFKTDHHNFSLYFGINNLLDRSYETSLYNPMPGRWFKFGLRYSFKKG